MQLTKNFNRQEFDCKDGTKVPDEFLQNVQEVANNLQILKYQLELRVVDIEQNHIIKKLVAQNLANT